MIMIIPQEQCTTWQGTFDPSRQTVHHGKPLIVLHVNLEMRPLMLICYIGKKIKHFPRVMEAFVVFDENELLQK
jgi:hypothetical protein